MKTAKILTRIICMLLLLSILLCSVACAKAEEPQNTETVVGTKESGLELPFDKENYGKDVTILYYSGGSIYKNFYFDDVTEAGDVIKSALVERRAMIQDYLGVNVIGKAEGEKEASIVEVISRDTLAGIDQYQIALTHGYIGLGNLVTQNYVVDLYELEDISFNEEYWSVDAIEALEIGGKAYFGTSDFMVADVQCVFFNKTMYAEQQIKDDPYELVRSGEWTLEKFMQLCSNVAVNSGDPRWDKEDTYGLGVRADWEFIPLVDACEVQWLTGSGYKTLNMGPNNEKYQTLYEKVEEMADAEWSYMYNWGDNENKVTIADNRFLFTMEPVKYAHTYLSSNVTFGMLPYPKFDVDQEEYHTLDAGGMICVPTTVKDKEMVGKTLECLAFYSAETVNLAYYERLLGTRVAEAPDDAEMLEKYIFGTITLNPAYNYSEKANMPLGILVYTIPKMLRAKLNGTEISTIAHNWASYRIAAQKVIDSTINR